MFYILYDTSTGSATARPIVGSGSTVQIVQKAGNIVMHEVATELTMKPDWGYTFNPTNDTVSSIAPPAPPAETIYSTSIMEAVDRMNALLRQSDWTQLADADISSAQLAAWNTFRAELRAVPDQPGFPGTITWPAVPSASLLSTEGGGSDEYDEYYYDTI